MKISIPDSSLFEPIVLSAAVTTKRRSNAANSLTARFGHLGWASPAGEISPEVAAAGAARLALARNKEPLKPLITTKRLSLPQTPDEKE